MPETPSISIRPEIPADIPAIYALNAAAFDRPAEAELIERLRAAGAVSLSHVAESDGILVGHALWTPVHVRAQRENKAAVALGPIAVAPAWQGQGVGGTLIRAGLAALRTAGHQIVFVLGHSSYYPRFGFKPSQPFDITCGYDVPVEAFMVLPLTPAALTGLRGVVEYRPEFDGDTVAPKPSPWIQMGASLRSRYRADKWCLKQPQTPGKRIMAFASRCSSPTS